MIHGAHVIIYSTDADVDRAFFRDVLKYPFADAGHGCELSEKGIECSPISEQRWGSIIQLTLPGGGKLGVYQPKHPSPLKPGAAAQ